jgi:GGDEF domain-containing protein
MNDLKTRKKAHHLKMVHPKNNDLDKNTLKMTLSKLKDTHYDLLLLEEKLAEITNPKEGLDYSSAMSYLSDKIGTIRQNIREIEVKIKTDDLTGTLSKKGLEELLEKTRKSEFSSGILYVDMMGLKEINDNYGHDRGDLAIKDVATTLRGLIRSKKTESSHGERRFSEENYQPDMIYSMNESDVGRPYEGGDEFIGVLANIKGPKELKIVLERISNHFNEDNISPIAIGATIYNPYEDIERKISCAEEAMYSVKREIHQRKNTSKSSILETDYGIN